MSTNRERQICCPSIFKKINALASFQICKQYRCVFGCNLKLGNKQFKIFWEDDVIASMLGAIFEHTSVNVSLVADGYHVEFATIRIAKKILGERLFLIKDAGTENLNT